MNQRNWKRTLAWVMVLTMCLSLFPAASATGTETAAETHEEHVFKDGVCEVCGLTHEEHVYSDGVCEVCGLTHEEHVYSDGACEVCGLAHEEHVYKDGACEVCGLAHEEHVYKDGACEVCGLAHEEHVYKDGACEVCGEEEAQAESAGDEVQPKSGVLRGENAENTVAVSISMEAEDAELTVRTLSEEENAALGETLYAAFGGAYETVLALDITVAGSPFETDREVTVKAAALNGLDAQSAKLYHVDSVSGEAEQVGYTVTGEDGIVFSARSFSPYVVVRPAQESAGTEEETPVVTLTGSEPLVEIAESANEPLLAMGNLSPATLKRANAPLLNAGNLRGGNAIPMGDETGRVYAPQSAGDIRIEGLTVQWVGTDGNPLLRLTPADDTVDRQRFQIDFTVKGQKEFAPGDMEVVFPAYIWKNHSQAELGTLALSVPQDPSTSWDFAWKRVGDTIVVTNTRTLASTTSVMMQGEFVGIKAHDVIDVDVSSESDYWGYPSAGGSIPFYASLSVTRDGQTVTADTHNIRAVIDTSVSVVESTVTKTAGTGTNYAIYRGSAVTGVIPEELLAKLPEGDDVNEYVFVRWFIAGQAQGNQSFDLIVRDEIVEGHNGVLLGLTGAPTPSADGKSAEAVIYSGYNLSTKSCYAWTAYKLGETTETVTVENTATVTVRGWDDRIESSKTVRASVTIAQYTVKKVWDDNDNAAGRRPSSVTITVRRGSKSTLYLTLNEANGWTASFFDDGVGFSNLSVSEGTLPASIREERGEVYYEADGTRCTPITRYTWRYTGEKEYEASNRTYTFTNTFHESTTSWVEREAIRYFEPWTGGDVYKSVRDLTYSSRYDTHDHLVNTLRTGLPVELSYNVSGNTTVTRWTYDPYGTDRSDRNHYYKEEVTAVLEDSGATVNGVSAQPEDVYLKAVTVQPARLYVKTQLDQYSAWENTPVPAEVSAAQKMKLEALVDGAWTLVDGEIPNDEAHSYTLPEGSKSFRISATTKEADVIALSATVTVKVNASETVQAAIESQYTENNDYAMLVVDNAAQMYAKDATGTTLQSRSVSARGYLHGRNTRTAVRIDPSATGEGGSLSDPTEDYALIYTFGATVTQQSNMVTLLEYREAVESGEALQAKEGRWYALYPTKLNLIPDSVSVAGGAGNIRSVYTVPNYKGGNYTLLVVDADIPDNVGYVSDTSYGNNYPLSGYKQSMGLSFRAGFPFEDYINTYGQTGTTSVTMSAHIAFEATNGDDSTGMVLSNVSKWNGVSDNAPTASGSNPTNKVAADVLTLMTDLDAFNGDARNFIYTTATATAVPQLLKSNFQIRKLVGVDGVYTSGLTENSISVKEGGLYSYLISAGLGNSSDYKYRDVYLFDRLEYLTDAEKAQLPGVEGATWRGELLSVDVSRIEELGVAPVVYYSTADFDSLDITGYTDAASCRAALENGALWTSTAPADMSTVTAIAIDCSKGSDGADFVLEENKTLMAYLYMRAPYVKEGGYTEDELFLTVEGSTDAADPANNAHAYNETHVCYGMIEKASENVSYQQSAGATKLGLTPTALSVRKEWNDGNDQDVLRHDSVTLTLRENGVNTTRQVELKASEGWTKELKHLPEYDKNGNYITYSFLEDGEDLLIEIDGQQLTYTATVRRAGDAITVTNSYDPQKTVVAFRKEWTGDTDEDGAVKRYDVDGDGTEESARPEWIQVKLYRDGEESPCATQLVRPSTDGSWTGLFTGLAKYYNDNGERREHVYTVGEADMTLYRLTSVTVDAESGEQVLTNEYHPYGDLSIRNELRNAESAAAKAAEFRYTLVLTDVSGNNLIDEYRYAVVNTEDGSPALDGAGEPITGRIASGNTFTLLGGQTLVVYEVPHGTRYEVTEDDTAGYTLTTEDNTTGRVIANRTVSARFVNRYAAQGRAQLEATTVLSGRELEAYQFRFQVRDLTPGSESYGGTIRTATNLADGSVSFGQISYTEADQGKTFVYEVTEQDRGRNGYTYDKRVYLATVTVVDNGDGTLTAEPVYTLVTNYELGDDPAVDPADYVTVPTENEGAAKPVFENAYEARGSLTLRAWKRLPGRALQDGEFSFELWTVEETDDGSGTPVRAAVKLQPESGETLSNDADGEIVFAALNYTQDDVGKQLLYIAREVEGSDPTVIYTKEVKGWLVTVSDNGDGTLSPYARNVELAVEACADCEGDGHANETECAVCGGWGVMKDTAHTEPCAECGGDGKVNDGTAEEAECASCGGTGAAKAALPIFRNELVPGSLSLTKQTTGTDTATTLPDESFTFHIRLIGEELDPDAPLTYTVEETTNPNPINGRNGTGG